MQDEVDLSLSGAGDCNGAKSSLSRAGVVGIPKHVVQHVGLVLSTVVADASSYQWYAMIDKY